MNRSCSENGEGRSAFKILTVKPTGKYIQEGLSVDGRTILECIRYIKTRNGVNLAQERDYWRALVNAAVNLWVQAEELVC